jgi:hypothetical protein
MSLQQFTATQQPDYDEAIDPEYDQGADPDYDDVIQPSYDEGAQPDYDTDVADPDAQEASQEWSLRKQK